MFQAWVWDKRLKRVGIGFSFAIRQRNYCRGKTEEQVPGEGTVIYLGLIERLSKGIYQVGDWPERVESKDGLALKCIVEEEQGDPPRLYNVSVMCAPVLRGIRRRWLVGC